MPAMSKLSQGRKSAVMPAAGAAVALGGLGCFVAPASSPAAAPARAVAAPAEGVPHQPGRDRGAGVGTVCGVAVAAAAGASAARRRGAGRRPASSRTAAAAVATE
ncbi:unnamed protein product, partial [Prorocentrum cordatum]